MVNFLYGDKPLLKDKNGTTVDPNKVGWPDLKFDTVINKFVYKDKMCTVYAEVKTTALRMICP